MKKITAIIFCVLIFSKLSAQNIPCHFDKQMKSIKAKLPLMEKLWKDADKKSKQNISNRSQQTIVTVPVVVHVVYHTAGENISDLQIQSEIDVLNEDFRKLNSDTGLVRSIFKPVAGDAMIQFCLAQRDPNGDTTSGITRNYCARTDWGCDDSMKFSSNGGADGWPGSDYLNIWVCRLNCANGYAYYPGTPDPYDGVVVHYYVFGRVGNIAPGYKGRTCDHEVGHYFGLYHTFDYGSCSGSDAGDCGAGGDQICDTPADSIPDYGCPAFVNDCIDTPVDYPDQTENYMSYSDDSCRIMFSKGQVDRMQGFLFGARASLITSAGCIPPGVNYYDASVLNLNQPLAEICSSTITPVIEIGNGCTSILNLLTMDYQLDGGTVNTFMWSGAINPSSRGLITLPSIAVTPGYHVLHVLSRLPNGIADQNNLNDSADFSFRVLTTGDGMQMPYTEGFETSTFPPVGWLMTNPGNGQAWEPTTTASGYGASNACARFQNFYNGAYGTTDALISPKFDFSGLSNVALSFDEAYCQPDFFLYSDTLKVYYSLDCGDTWNLIYTKGGDNLATAPTPVVFSEFVPDATQWRTETVILNSLLGNPLVTIKFEDVSHYGNDLYLDNINFSTFTKVNEIFTDNFISVYPNPSEGQFTINNSRFEIKGIEIYNTLGEKVYTEELNTKYKILSIQLSSGIYFLQLRTERGEVHKKISVVIK